MVYEERTADEQIEGNAFLKVFREVQVQTYWMQLFRAETF